MFNMVHVSSNHQQGQQFPQQGQQFPYAMTTPMMFSPNGMTPVQNAVSPGMSPMQLPMHMPLNPIPLQAQVSQNSQGKTGETSKLSSPPQAPFPPQAFQPIQLMNMGNRMMMNYNGQTVPNQVQPNLIPMIQIQTPNGPAFQPVLYVPDMQKSFLNTPEQHPVQRSESMSSVGRSSFDGSEVSDSGSRLHSNSLIRHHSSCDSNYSDCSNSRLGSEYFEGSFCSDMDGEEQSQKSYPPGFGNSSGSFDGLVSSMSSCTLASNQSFSRKSSEDKKRKKSHQRSHSKRYYQDGQKRPTSKERQEELFKTDLCSYWINGQKCRFGKRCIFAHGQQELRMPKRKVERNRLRPPFRKKVVSTLNKLNESNAESMVSTLLCSAVEDIRNDKETALIFTKALFNKAVNQTDLLKCYSEIWRKLLNIHPMAQVFAAQMQNLCLSEYNEPRHKEAGLGAMKFAADMCAKKTLKSEETVHKILGEMFQDGQASEKNVELWCKLIESLKNNVDTNKYFPQLTAMKTRFNHRVRFMIMDLEDLKKRNWVRRT